VDAMAAEKKVNPLESVMSSMGKTRDLDGSVDRVPDPPTKLWPVLASMEYYCRHANMHLESIFSEGGGNHFGVMKNTNFFSTMKDNFTRFQFAEEILIDLMQHYGVGYKDPRGRYEKIGWMDFCEDVHRSVGEGYDDMYGVQGVAEALAFQRGAVISYRTLADLDDAIDDTLQRVAAEDVTGFVSANQVMEGRTRDSISMTGAESRFN